jgi:hypothetical protein
MLRIDFGTLDRPPTPIDYWASSLSMMTGMLGTVNLEASYLRRQLPTSPPHSEMPPRRGSHGKGTTSEVGFCRIGLPHMPTLGKPAIGGRHSKQARPFAEIVLFGLQVGAWRLAWLVSLAPQDDGYELLLAAGVTSTA